MLVGLGVRPRRITATLAALLPPLIRILASPGDETLLRFTEDYARAFTAQKGLPIDLWPASHASQFKLHEKYRPGDAFNPDRFVDPQGFKTSVEQLGKTYREQLARERAKTR